VTIFGVIAGFSYYVLTVRNAQRNRKSQMFLPIYSRFQDDEWIMKYLDVMHVWEWTDSEEFYDKYGSLSNLETFSTFIAVGGFFHTTGSLLLMGQTDSSLVYTVIPSVGIQFWEKYGPIIVDMRKRLDVPTWLHGAEYLANEMKKIREEKGLPTMPQ